MDVEVGWIVKWHSYFGDRQGKVISVEEYGAAYISEARSTQGFPGVGGPVLVSRKDIFEVVSRGE